MDDTNYLEMEAYDCDIVDSHKAFVQDKEMLRVLCESYKDRCCSNCVECPLASVDSLTNFVI